MSAINEANPYDRPLSRRGSRDSTPEKGHEEFEDTLSVESLEPLGDTSGSPQNRSQIPPEITFEQSSSDESEDESNELYHKLKEEEDEPKAEQKVEEKEEPKAELKEGPNKLEKEECFDSDEELLNENRMMERHAYERLEESPLPSPSIYTNNNSVANNNSPLKTKSTEEAVNNLSEEMPDDGEEEDLR